MAHRADLQGLRGVAVLLVALGHAGVPLLAGGYVGVDVFFVLSGFLITGLLLAQAARTGRVSLTDFYMRRARRILPAAALTLVATDLAAYHLLNAVRAREAVADSVWASLFAANVDFAREGGDYFAQGEPPSPVQHFWSLGVEEQFYLVWPAVVSLVLCAARHRPRASGRLLLAVVLAAAVASLAWSVNATSTNPASAYFSTLARAWELAIGAALAIVAARVATVPTRARAAVGWGGLLAIAAAAVSFSHTTDLPGSAALLPTLGAALVIASGTGGGAGALAVSRLLSLRPLRYVGDRSYAFYLWHWPVLVIGAQYVGRDLPLAANLVLLAGAFGLSVLSYALWENPMRHLRWPARAGVALWPASAAAVIAVALFTLGALDDTLARMDAASAAVRPSALADPSVRARPLADPKPLPAVAAAARAARRGAPLPAALTPPVRDLAGDFYFFPDGCTPGRGQSVSRICRLGDPRGTKTLVVFGDSHAQMWMPTVLRMAQRDGWIVIPLVKVGCVPGFWLRGLRGCGEWYRWATRRVAALRPDVTLVAGSWGGTKNPRPDIRAVDALSRAARRSSMSVVVIGDAPHQRVTPVDCLLARNASMARCATRPSAGHLRADDAVSANAGRANVGYVRTRGWFCASSAPTRRDYVCPLVINQTISWVDRGHISRTYGLQLTDSFRAAFRRALFS